MKRVLPLIALALLASPAESAPKRIVLAKWELSCVAGTDGFAANCTAQALSEGLKARFATADDQLSITLEAAGCASPVTEILFRDQVLGMSRSERRQFYQTFVLLARAMLEQQCGPIPMIVVRRVPDIAAMGEAALKP